jgi:hypothetical protein
LFGRFLRGESFEGGFDTQKLFNHKAREEISIRLKKSASAVWACPRPAGGNARRSIAIRFF